MISIQKDSGLSIEFFFVLSNRYDEKKFRCNCITCNHYPLFYTSIRVLNNLFLKFSMEQITYYIYSFRMNNTSM